MYALRFSVASDMHTYIIAEHQLNNFVIFKYYVSSIYEL